MTVRTAGAPLQVLLAWTWLCAALAVGLGCQTRQPPQATSVARDSAGVRIVENSGAASAVPWTVDRDPFVTIGSVSGDPDQELDQVTGAVRLGNDRIVVANGGRLELLFYDGEGNLLGRAGGRGGGPGEFESLEWVARYGPDSVLALDVWGQRVSYFDASGTFVRSVRLEPNARLPFPRPVGFFADGSFLATKGIFALGGEPPEGRVERELEPLFRISSDGRIATLLGSFPGRERVIVPTGPRGGLERRARPFGRETAYGAAGDRFYVADNESYEIRIYSMTGLLTQIVRNRAAPRRLEASHIQAYQDSVLEGVAEVARPQMSVLFANLPAPPTTYPAYAPAIHIDPELNLWVKEVAPSGEPASSWSVFSAAGQLLGVVEMPPGLKVLEIGADHVLGLRLDELDVEYVQCFRLHRGHSAR